MCARLLRDKPASAATTYFRRARLRAHLFRFDEATADNLAGLVLPTRKPAGKPADKR